jgi:glutaredoxin
MRLFMMMLLFSLQLFAAGEGFPQLFSKMGDPLFSFGEHVKVLQSDAALGKEASAFSMQAAAVCQAGLAAERATDASVKTAYLQQLRALQTSYERMMVKIKKSILAAMKAGDSARFLKLVSTEPAVIGYDRNLKTQIRTFYKAKHLAGRSAFLDRTLANTNEDAVEYVEDKGISQDGPAAQALKSSGAGKTSGTEHMKAPNNEVIVVGTPTCPYCQKARSFLSSKGIAFRDLNVNTSAEGQRLYKKYGGGGVPLIIIGDAHMTGYNPGWIMTQYSDGR